MALTLVSPACCCSTNAEDTHKTRSCCHGTTLPNDKEDGPKICACKTHDPKDKAEAIVIPDGSVRDIVPSVYEFSFVSSTYFTPVITAIFPYIIDDPLEDILVRYSRWLI
jgi:hypothetical protein